MRTINVIVAVMLLALVMVGCAGSKATSSTSQSASKPTGQTQQAAGVPEWFTPPQDPNFFYEATTATSQDMQLALDKAITSARAGIARQIDVLVKSNQKKFDEETGFGKDAQLLQYFSQATTTVTATSQSGSRVKRQQTVREGEGWRAYVLVEYPVGAANQALMQQIKGNEQMYTRFRASEAFKDLDEDVKKYDEWKKQQGQTPR